MAVRGRAFGAGRLLEWRMRRAGSLLFEARRAPRLFEKVANAIGSCARKKKPASFGKSLVLTAGPNILADLVEASSRN